MRRPGFTDTTRFLDHITKRNAAGLDRRRAEAVAISVSLTDAVTYRGARGWNIDGWVCDPVTFQESPNGVTWPAGPAWLCSPCGTYGLGGVAAGLGALLDR
jgi:hypothetical protein